MVVWALRSLPFIEIPNYVSKTKKKARDEDLVFVCLVEHEDKFGISSVLKKYFGKNINVVFTSSITRGAAETVYLAKKFINPEEDLIISDSDHYFKGKSFYNAILEKTENTAGIIPVFKPRDKELKWSYSLLNKEKKVLAVGEKDYSLAKRGAYANIGAYYFSKGKIFLDEAFEMIKKNEMYGNPGKEEFFVAPIYQKLINKRMEIKAVIIPRVWGLGTPADLDFFIANFK